jgi:hypothetical protein
MPNWHSDALLVSHAVQTGQLAEDMLTELPRPGAVMAGGARGSHQRAKLMPEVERERSGGGA